MCISMCENNIKSEEELYNNERLEHYCWRRTAGLRTSLKSITPRRRSTTRIIIVTTMEHFILSPLLHIFFKFPLEKMLVFMLGRDSFKQILFRFNRVFFGGG